MAKGKGFIHGSRFEDIRGKLNRLAFSFDLDLRIVDESTSLLTKTVTFEVSGDLDKIEDFKKALGVSGHTYYDNVCATP